MATSTDAVAARGLEPPEDPEQHPRRQRRGDDPQRPGDQALGRRVVGADVGPGALDEEQPVEQVHALHVRRRRAPRARGGVEREDVDAHVDMVDVAEHESREEVLVVVVRLGGEELEVGAEQRDGLRP